MKKRFIRNRNFRKNNTFIGKIIIFTAESFDLGLFGLDPY